MRSVGRRCALRESGARLARLPHFVLTANAGLVAKESGVDNFTEQLRQIIAGGSAISDEPLRVERDFVGNPPAAPASGLRVVAPDGSVYYLAVYEPKDFDREPEPS